MPSDRAKCFIATFNQNWETVQRLIRHCDQFTKIIRLKKPIRKRTFICFNASSATLRERTTTLRNTYFGCLVKRGGWWLWAISFMPPITLSPEKYPTGTLWIEGWVDLRVDLAARNKSYISVLFCGSKNISSVFHPVAYVPFPCVYCVTVMNKWFLVWFVDFTALLLNIMKSWSSRQALRNIGNHLPYDLRHIQENFKLQPISLVCVCVCVRVRVCVWERERERERGREGGRERGEKLKSLCSTADWKLLNTTYCSLAYGVHKCVGVEIQELVYNWWIIVLRHGGDFHERPWKVPRL